MMEIRDYGSHERRWRPLGADAHTGNPEIGALVAVDHTVYRVQEIRPKPRIDWDQRGIDLVERHGEKAAPVNVIVRPAHITGDDPKLCRHDKHLRAYGEMSRWWVYPHEHYPICASCSEPMPCRERLAIETSESAAKHMARYEIAGICPACGEPVTQRQGSRTFDENLYMPGGPPVTFHASRRECWSGLVKYEDKWVQADPENRKRRYRCRGVLTTHTSTVYECSLGVECPGPQASHLALTGCSCPEHERIVHRLAKDALNIALEPQGGEVA